MKQVILLFALGLVALALPERGIGAGQPTPAKWGRNPVTVRKLVPVVASEAVPTARPGLSIKQRREMGLTFRNVRKILAKKHQAGELDGREVPTIALEVMAELVDADPSAFDREIDWDKLFEFLERLIELIMKLVAIFGTI